MRTLILLAVVLVLTASVLWIATGSRTSAPVVPEPAAASTAEPATSGAGIDTGIDEHGTDATGSRSALPVSSPEAVDGRHRSASGKPCSLRVRVRFAQKPGFESRGLDVRVSDQLGVQRDARRESPNEFVVPALAAGTYTVAVKEPSSLDATQRVELVASGHEHRIDFLLVPKTSLVLRWRAADGRPIEVALLDAPIEAGHKRLIVHISHVPILEDGPRPTTIAIATLQKDVHILLDEETDRLIRVPPPSSWSRTMSPPPPPEDDVFGTLDIRSEGPLWASAWLSGVLIDTQEVAQGQREVVFTTPLEHLRTALVPISLCLVDDETGQPVTGATVSAAGVTRTQFGVDQTGCGTLEVEPGSTLLRIDPASSDVRSAGGRFGRAGAVNERQALDPRRTRGFAPVTIRVQVLKDQPHDLGQVRLFRPRTLRFRVVDAHGKLVPAAEFTLARLASYDGTGAPYDLQRAWSDGQGIVTFKEAAREQYVLTCSSPRIDAEPLVVDAAAVPDEPEAILRDIVLGPVRQISLVFDEVPHPGTLVMIETPEGLPVRTIEIDEFGVVPVWLGGSAYRLHLVEDGAATSSVRFSVSSDPFVFRIGR